MRFASETTRMLFHELPTEKQVAYADLEVLLAEQGRVMHVDSVMSDGCTLEVVIRIGEKLHLNPGG